MKQRNQIREKLQAGSNPSGKKKKELTKKDQSRKSTGNCARTIERAVREWKRAAGVGRKGKEQLKLILSLRKMPVEL